jgi:hypothetical protein
MALVRPSLGTVKFGLLYISPRQLQAPYRLEVNSPAPDVQGVNPRNIFGIDDGVRWDAAWLAA